MFISSVAWGLWIFLSLSGTVFSPRGFFRTEMLHAHISWSLMGSWQATGRCTDTISILYVWCYKMPTLKPESSSWGIFFFWLWNAESPQRQQCYSGTEFYFVEGLSWKTVVDGLFCFLEKCIRNFYPNCGYDTCHKPVYFWICSFIITHCLKKFLL